MARDPELEALLEAKLDLDTCADDQLGSYRQRFEELLDCALAKSADPNATREMLEEALREPYREFRLAKIRQERARLSRLR